MISPKKKGYCSELTDAESSPQEIITKKAKYIENPSDRDFNSKFNSEQIKLIQSCYSSAAIDDPILILNFNTIWLENQDNIIGIYTFLYISHVNIT